MFHRGRDELLAEASSFIRDGLAADEPTVALLSGETLEPLRTELGTVGERVRLEDVAVLGRNPARILPVLQELVDRHREPVRIIGQTIWPGHSDAAITEAIRHERLVNSVLATTDALIVCAYDMQLLSDATVEAVRRAHPQIASTGRGLRDTPDYIVEDAAGHLRNGLERAEPPVEEIAVTPDLSDLRDRVASSRLTASLSDRQREDFVLAVNEVAANALEYGQAPRVARLWRAGASVVAEVVARGRIDDPLIGRRPPDPHAVRGRGLWIVNQLCDLVQLRQDGPRTRLRLHMYLG